MLIIPSCTITLVPTPAAYSDPSRPGFSDAQAYADYLDTPQHDESDAFSFAGDIPVLYLASPTPGYVYALTFGA